MDVGIKQIQRFIFVFTKNRFPILTLKLQILWFIYLY